MALPTIPAVPIEDNPTSLSNFINLAKRRPELFAIVNQMVYLLLVKGADYNEGQGDTYNNLRSCEVLGVPGWKGVLIRLGDKWARICSFAKKEEYEVKDESFEDTLFDNANYSLLAIVLYRMRNKDA